MDESVKDELLSLVYDQYHDRHVSELLVKTYGRLADIFLEHHRRPRFAREMMLDPKERLYWEGMGCSECTIEKVAGKMAEIVKVRILDDGPGVVLVHQRETNMMKFSISPNIFNSKWGKEVFLWSGIELGKCNCWVLKGNDGLEVFTEILGEFLKGAGKFDSNRILNVLSQHPFIVKGQVDDQTTNDTFSLNREIEEALREKTLAQKRMKAVEAAYDERRGIVARIVREIAYSTAKRPFSPSRLDALYDGLDLLKGARYERKDAIENLRNARKKLARLNAKRRQLVV